MMQGMNQAMDWQASRTMLHLLIFSAHQSFIPSFNDLDFRFRETVEIVY